MIKRKNTILLLSWPLGILGLTICMFLFPQATYNGAKYGLETWAFTLVPSLLPFMIMADMLIELGIVRFLGVLLEPLMRPLFKLPGEAGFAVAMGFTSGFPMGALLTNSLYQKSLCTKDEATRLVTFTNNASPLFLLVAIPIGMLHLPQLGVILLAAHYIANIIIGIGMGCFAQDKTPARSDTHHLLRRSFSELFQNRQASTLTIGSIISAAIGKGIHNILSIGGFVLFFSVLIAILDTVHFFRFTNLFFNQFLASIHFNPAFSEALSRGLFEMTLGTRAVSETSAPLLQQIILISLILGWSGLSIHAQVGSIIAASHISLLPYTLCRIVQGLLAAILSCLFFLLMPQSITTMLPVVTLTPAPHIYGILMLLPLINLTLLLSLSLLFYLLGQLYQSCRR